MYFVLSKALGFFSTPSNIISCLALLALLLLLLRRPAGKAIAFASLLMLVIAAFSPLGNMLLTPLEQRFPGMNFPDRPIDGVIILGGSYDTQIRGYKSTVVFEEDTEPMAIVAELARRYPAAKIIFSGGRSTLFVGTGEADAARHFFISLGIDPNRILIEDQSRNTVENAQLTFRLINPSPQMVWLLVTSAYHMPRAIGAFRKAGFRVIGFPVGWRTNGWRDFYWPAFTATENLRRVDISTREWLGLATYRVLGYSTELFPAATNGAESR